VRHETFKDAAVGEAFQLIEGSVLPSLTLLLESAAAAQPGVDAEAKAQELRLLAGQLEALTRLFGDLSGSVPGDH
jgi:hypothetical protein